MPGSTAYTQQLRVRRSAQTEFEGGGRAGPRTNFLEAPDLLSLPCSEAEEEEQKEKEKERDGEGGHLFQFSDTIEEAGGR